MPPRLVAVGDTGSGIKAAETASVRCRQLLLSSLACCALVVQAASGQTLANPYGVTPDGTALAQNDAAIEQSRLYRDIAPPTAGGVDANGTAVGAVEPSSSGDDSFGAQMILKNQEKPRPFTLSGGVSLVYTSNVALTRADTQDDVFAVAGAGIAWTPKIGPNLDASVGGRVSLFRYDKTSELDFESVGVGVGFTWHPTVLRGASIFAGYDFTELFDADGGEILRDHVFTLGLQKVFVFGRSHALTVGAVGTPGISDPFAAQRHQIGGFVGYHLQVARHFEADLFYRPAVHVYSGGDRTDFNQVVSLNLRYRLSDWADVSAFFSYGANRSDRAVFDYDAVTSGVGLSANLRF